MVGKGMDSGFLVEAGKEAAQKMLKVIQGRANEEEFVKDRRALIRVMRGEPQEEYRHKEAFCLMWYFCSECAHHERIWNSRDGVTPFGTACTSCGGMLRHVDFDLDECVPEYKPHRGQRVWRDGTPGEAEAIMRWRLNMGVDSEFPPTDEHKECLPKAARMTTAGEAEEGDEFFLAEFVLGWPTLAVTGYV